MFQIKLFQGAANAYNIHEDFAFDRWFDSILTLDDREAYQLSCHIEAPVAPSLTITTQRHKKRSG